MIDIVGITVIIVGLIAWLGQSLSFIAPEMATKLGLLEPKEDMDESFYIIEAKALCLNDMLLSWVFPASGVLMLLDNPLWPYFGLVGAGIFLYFSGLVAFMRIYLKRGDKKIGNPVSEKVAYTYSVICSLVSISMMFLSYSNLS